MDIPRFNQQSINHRFAFADIGEAFQVFVYELLQHEYPQLHRFPAGGKDGGIDLIDTSNGELVIECKFVGEDEFSLIEQRWKTVSKLLEKHLQNPNGPTPGQSQYGPWVSTLNPITDYQFCVSAVIANNQQRRTLQQSIAGFFQGLARRYPHLAHLSALNVTVIDWNDLTAKLSKRPHLIFRWFPSARPSGLVPLDEMSDVGTFRAYLTNAKLPYYKLAEHLHHVPSPPGTSILDEETLLACFDNPETTGLVISGKGGVGKSRLTLELGRLAWSKGWTVMRVQSRLKEDALEKFAEQLTPDTPALLLVDYIETQSDFGELVETINVLNDSGVAQLRYVAACRTNFYHRAIAASERHLPVDLTPPPGSLTLDWFASYRRQTVERILAKAGLAAEKYLAVCNNVPILAVFLSYLQTAGRTEDLAELLAEVEFGRWVAKRVQLTFPDRKIARELALLIPLFPMPESAVGHFAQTIYREIFEDLATDGWIEKVPATEPGLTETWVTAHDVLADQILLAYARSIPETIEIFVAQLFSLAATIGCLSSALLSVQRASDSPPLNSVRWFKVISEAIAANKTAWYEVRDLLITTTLLSTSEQLNLLRSYETLWTGAEQELTFQKRLGWLGRRVIKHREEVTEQDRSTLLLWVIKSAPFAQRSNFVLTWGLRLAPATLKDAALEWIVTKPTLLQTHYLMVAWLECGLGTEVIAPLVEQWSRRFSRSFHFSFLVKAWLDARGDRELVRNAIADWLVEHGRNMAAEFVYKAWLDAGGDTDLIREGVSNWLEDHRRTLEAEFVYKAWLDAGGDPDFLREAITDWIADHRRTLQAEFVYEAWLNAGGETVFVKDAIEEWMVDHGRTAPAQYVYTAWLGAGGNIDLVKDAIRDWLIDHGGSAEAGYIYTAWLDASGDHGLVEDAIRDWLIRHGRSLEAGYVYKAWLDARGDPGLVRKAITEWLTDHGNTQAAQFVYKAWLDAGGDTGLVRDAIEDWLNDHRRMLDAPFVYKAWLDAGGDTGLVRDGIEDWLTDHRATQAAQFVYKSWLDAGGDSDLVKEGIRDWLVAHGRRTEAHFVYKPWLDVTGDTDLVQNALNGWLADHRRLKEANFVYDAWLDAGGDTYFVQDAISEWLTDHRSTEEASHVYKAWLDAKGDKAVVKAALEDWLLLHADAADADHVFRAWLQAGGEREVVWGPATAWLTKHCTEESAVYVTKFIAKQKGLSSETVKDVLTWCRTFPDNEDALWRLTQLRENLLLVEIADDVVATTELVLDRLLDPTTNYNSTTKGQILAALLPLINSQGTQSGPLRERVDGLLVRWLKHPRSFGVDQTHVRFMRSIALPRRVSVLIENGALDSVLDNEPLSRFTEWLNDWDVESKRELLPLLTKLKSL
jgi:IS5 family transposase